MIRRIWVSCFALFALCSFVTRGGAQRCDPGNPGSPPYIACSVAVYCNSGGEWEIRSAESQGTPCSTTYGGPITGTCVVIGAGVFVNAACSGPFQRSRSAALYRASVPELMLRWSSVREVTLSMLSRQFLVRTARLRSRHQWGLVSSIT